MNMTHAMSVFMWCTMSTFVSTFVGAMQTDRPDRVSREKTVCTTVKDIATVGSVAGGWMFYWATAQSKAHLPYWAKRMPLFTFLASNTVAHVSSYLDSYIRTTPSARSLYQMHARLFSENQTDKQARLRQEDPKKPGVV